MESVRTTTWALCGVAGVTVAAMIIAALLPATYIEVRARRVCLTLAAGSAANLLVTFVSFSSWRGSFLVKPLNANYVFHWYELWGTVCAIVFLLSLCGAWLLDKASQADSEDNVVRVEKFFKDRQSGKAN